MKTPIIFFCVIISSVANAQKHSLAINYKPSLSYFGKQDQSFKHYYFQSRKGDQTFRNAVSILYSYSLLSKVSVATGLEYAGQGQNIKFTADSASPSHTSKILNLELNYLRIPLLVNYSFIQRPAYKLNVYAGLSFGLAVKRNDNYQNIILEDILLPPANKRYKDQDWAIPIGLSFRKKITSKIFINAGAEYSYGLTNAFSETGISKFGVLSEFDNSRQTRLSLNLGIGFDL